MLTQPVVSEAILGLGKCNWNKEASLLLIMTTVNPYNDRVVSLSTVIGALGLSIRISQSNYLNLMPVLRNTKPLIS